MLTMSRQSQRPTLDRLRAVVGGDLRNADDAAVVIGGVHQDSRKIERGDLFVALEGAQVDGARFARAAMERGAVAVMVRRGRALDVEAPILEVDDTRSALAKASAEIYGRPTEHMTVIGVTGTNGKTTTTHLIERGVAAAGGRIGIIGTLGHRFESQGGALAHTSPEADELQRIAADMRRAGATHLAMEVSSIALAAHRVDEIAFDVAVFTNLTQDHLDWHGSMEAYAAAKRALFSRHRPRVAVVNVDDAFGASLRRGDHRVITTSTVPSTADRPDTVVLRSPPRFDELGLHVELWAHDRVVALTAPLFGSFNVANALSALGAVIACDLDVAPAAAALRDLPQVPGRLERCNGAGDDIVALVDYAHTPDALATILRSVRPARGRLWCVFGCGGDRDPTKRGPMGAAVAQHADVAIVTNDNPRSEDPARIADAIVAGMAGAAPRVELDRRAAIALAIDEAAPGDVVVIAGKGHETYQIIGDRVAAFDDRDEVRRALERRRERRGR